MPRAVGKDIEAFQDGTVRQMEGGNRIETDVALSELAQVQQCEAGKGGGQQLLLFGRGLALG